MSGKKNSAICCLEVIHLKQMDKGWTQKMARRHNKQNGNENNVGNSIFISDRMPEC